MNIYENNFRISNAKASQRPQEKSRNMPLKSKQKSQKIINIDSIDGQDLPRVTFGNSRRTILRTHADGSYGGVSASSVVLNGRGMSRNNSSSLFKKSALTNQSHEQRMKRMSLQSKVSSHQIEEMIQKQKLFPKTEEQPARNNSYKVLLNKLNKEDSETSSKPNVFNYNMSSVKEGSPLDKLAVL